MSQPAYPNPLPAAGVAERLAEATTTTWHRFWPDEIGLIDKNTLNWNAVLGSRQITDCCLLALAAHHKGRFVTFDRRISNQSVPSARDEQLALIE